MDRTVSRTLAAEHRTDADPTQPVPREHFCKRRNRRGGFRLAATTSAALTPLQMRSRSSRKWNESNFIFRCI
jgi:hypothetical protein